MYWYRGYDRPRAQCWLHLFVPLVWLLGICKESVFLVRFIMSNAIGGNFESLKTSKSSKIVSILSIYES